MRTKIKRESTRPVTKPKVLVKSKRRNPDKDFKRELEHLRGELVTVRDKHGIFNGRLMYSADTRKNYYISITDMFVSNAFVSFKPSDVKSIFEEDMNIDITLM